MITAGIGTTPFVVAYYGTNRVIRYIDAVSAISKIMLTFMSRYDKENQFVAHFSKYP